MQSCMHASNLEAKGSTATEDAILATGLRKWRQGNRDIEGRNVAEIEMSFWKDGTPPGSEIDPLEISSNLALNF